MTVVVSLPPGPRSITACETVVPRLAASERPVAFSGTDTVVVLPARTETLADPTVLGRRAFVRSVTRPLHVLISRQRIERPTLPLRARSLVVPSCTGAVAPPQVCAVRAAPRAAVPEHQVKRASSSCPPQARGGPGPGRSSLGGCDRPPKRRWRLSGATPTSPKRSWARCRPHGESDRQPGDRRRRDPARLLVRERLDLVEHLDELRIYLLGADLRDNRLVPERNPVLILNLLFEAG